MVPVDIYMKHLLKILPGLSENQERAIKEAFIYANRAHFAQKRKSGEPYIIHPIEVSYLVALWNLDYKAIMAALLHDVVEDTPTTREEIDLKFGRDVGELVEGLTKISNINTELKHLKDIENYRKLIFALSKDLRVIIIKFADRIHNLKTLEHMPEEKQKRISKESLEIYAPLANRLGMNKIKLEIEYLAFKFYKPKMAKLIEEKLRKTAKETDEVLNEIVLKLTTKLDEIEIPFSLKWRTKSFYSIYEKYKKNDESFDGIYDILGIRIITDKIENCYKILGLIHQIYTPVTNRFKDYIAIPKNNGYQSIHTTFVNTRGQFIEAQVRTTNMDFICEYGIAAHVLYKERANDFSTFEKQISKLRKLINHDEVPMIEAFSFFKKELFKDEIYVFTPKGTILFLQDGATVLDFAFNIHTEIGLTCRAGLVNDRFVSISYKLANGDRVNVLTSNSVKPNSSWLKIAKTNKALAKIKHRLKDINRDEYIGIGATYLEKYFEKDSFNEKYDTILTNFLKKHTDIIDIDDLKFKVGTETIKPDSIFAEYRSPVKPEQAPPPKAYKSQILVDGMDNFAYKLAKCCMPLPGDDIVGIMTMADKISIHKRGCKELAKMSLGIELDVSWNSVQQKLHSKVLINTADDYIFIKILSELVKEQGSFIDEFSYTKKTNNTAEWSVTLLVDTVSHLSSIIKKIDDIEMVHDIIRL